MKRETIIVLAAAAIIFAAFFLVGWRSKAIGTGLVASGKIVSPTPLYAIVLIFAVLAIAMLWLYFRLIKKEMRLISGGVK